MENPINGGGGRLRPAAALLPTLALLLLALGALAPAALALTNPDPSLIAIYEPCEPNAGVTVIVDFQTLRTAPGDEPVYVGCALGEQLSGFAALQSASFAPQGTERWGPAFVCRLMGLPSAAGEPCVNTPPANAYWSYWKSRPGGQWAFSALGATDLQNPVALGSVEGWSFSTSTPSPAPRLAPLDASGPGTLTPVANPDGQEAAATAREWLRGQVAAILADSSLTGRAKIAKTVGSGIYLALATGAEGPEETAALSTLLGSGARDYISKGTDGSAFADLLSQVVLAVAAGGGDPAHVGGEDLRAELISLLAGPGSGVEGKVQNRSLKKGVPTYAHNPITVNTQALTVLALARSGACPRPAVDFLLSYQQANGSFSSPLTTAATLRPDTALTIVALAAARDSGSTGLDEPIARASAWLTGFQGADGGVLNAAGSGQPETVGTELTALAARASAAAGNTAAAQSAAAYLSSLQIVPAYAGDGLAKPDLAAVAPSPAGLKEALRYGIVAAQRDGFRASSGQALLGLEAALYGPPHLAPTPAAPAFDPRRVGTAGEPREIEFLSADRRSLRISAVRIEGVDSDEFEIDDDSCGVLTLTRGEGCSVAVVFSPTASEAGAREARLELTVAGIGPPITVPLRATATKAPAADEEPAPQQPPAPVAPAITPPSTGSVAALGGTRAIGRDRIAALATLTCNAGLSCQVKAPRRLRLTVAGHRYAAWVLAPASLGPGESGQLSVRLSQRGATALLGGAATVRVRVWLGSGDRFDVEEIEARVVGAVPPTTLANRRLSPSLRAGATAVKKETAR
jgi:hypothetical protein